MFGKDHPVFMRKKSIMVFFFGEFLVVLKDTYTFAIAATALRPLALHPVEMHTEGSSKSA